MSKVILINPPLAHKTGMPLISQMYLASSLIATEHKVKIIDLAAKYFKKNLKSTLNHIQSFHPDIIGINIYTETARSTYDLVSNLKASLEDLDFLLIAGGPHTTAVPEETLNQGFDIAVVGEGEETLVELAECCNCNNDLDLRDIKGISFNTKSLKIQHNPPRQKEQELDRIPLAVESLYLFEPKWYFKNETFNGVPPNLLTSRGCPAKCTFCANVVTGRKVRYRSSDNVLEEIQQYYEKYSSTFFSFLDDSFISNPKYTIELCDSLIRFREAENIDLQWSCITRVDNINAELLTKLTDAGCVSINFGIESGSNETLKIIKKGIDLEHIKSTLTSCQNLGLRTQVNFMLGFPWETGNHLNETLNYMKNIALNVDAFSPRGVVIPYPGTELYEQYKDRYQFENWWLDREIRSSIDTTDLENNEEWSNDVLKSVYFRDPALEYDFFKYSSDMKKMIERCLIYKGQQTLEKLNITEK
jgi:anaerobic magnesium-protoporphyrin IX monomethyl ester cyclase